MTAQTIYEGKLITVVVDDGMEIVHHRDAVAIVAVDHEDRIVLVRQPRPAIGRRLLELPAGLLEEGEAPLDCARRELREETGLRGGEWSRLAGFFMTPGFCDEQVHVFLAMGIEEGPASPDDDEELEVVRVPVGELRALLRDLEDAKTVAGLLLFLGG